MHALGIYATLLPTQDLMACQNIFKFGQNYIVYYIIADDDIILSVYFLFNLPLCWCNHHAIVKFYDRHLQSYLGEKPFFSVIIN